MCVVAVMVQYKPRGGLMASELVVVFVHHHTPNLASPLGRLRKRCLRSGRSEAPPELLQRPLGREKEAVVRQLINKI